MSSSSGSEQIVLSVRMRIWNYLKEKVHLSQRLWPQLATMHTWTTRLEGWE